MAVFVSSCAALCSLCRQHQRRAITSPVPSEDHFARIGMIYLVASKRSVTLLATCDMDGQCTCYRAHIEDRCWQRVANTHQIADINQRIDTGNIAFFGQAAQQGLGCAAILCWLNAKFTERASPRGQRGYLAERRIADALKYGALFSLESLLQGLWRRPILHLFP